MLKISINAYFSKMLTYSLTFLSEFLILRPLLSYSFFTKYQCIWTMKMCWCYSSTLQRMTHYFLLKASLFKLTFRARKIEQQASILASDTAVLNSISISIYDSPSPSRNDPCIKTRNKSRALPDIDKKQNKLFLKSQLRP